MYSWNCIYYHFRISILCDSIEMLCDKFWCASTKSFFSVNVVKTLSIVSAWPCAIRFLFLRKLKLKKSEKVKYRNFEQTLFNINFVKHTNHEFWFKWLKYSIFCSLVFTNRKTIFNRSRFQTSGDAWNLLTSNKGKFGFFAFSWMAVMFKIKST